MKDTATAPVEVSAAELQAQAIVLAGQIIDQVLQPQMPPVAVALEALLGLYRFHAEALDAHGQGLCAMALSQIAGDLLQASIQSAAPSGAAIH